MPFKHKNNIKARGRLSDQRSEVQKALLELVVDGEIMRDGLRLVGEREVRRLVLVHCACEHKCATESGSSEMLPSASKYAIKSHYVTWPSEFSSSSV